MERDEPSSKVFRVQSIGFLTIIVVFFLDEWLDLNSLVLGDHPYISTFSGVAFKVLVVFTVWFLVVRATRRIVHRVAYLEGFARVCAWCHHISFKGEWVRLEQFLQDGFDTPTTHGMCPKCIEAQRRALEKARQSAREIQPETPSPDGAARVTVPEGPAATTQR